MQEFFRPLSAFRSLSWQDAVQVADILLVAYLIYRLLNLIRGTRAWRLVAGILLFVVLLVSSNFLQLTTLHWILDKATLLAPVALVILLLPEMRQALEGIGKLGGLTEKLASTESGLEAHTVEEIVAAVAEMSAQRTGALLVIERSSRLDDVVANGVQIGAKVSAPLLGAVFYEGNPLHDGAAVIRGEMIAAAGCRLPLSENRLDQSLHMRHRAAVGITEQTDCIAVVVSEERGTISVCREGRLTRYATHAELRDYLNKELRHVAAGSDSSRRARFARARGGK